MNRREVVAGAATIAALGTLGVKAQAATRPLPVRRLSDLEHRLVRQGMYPEAPHIIAVQTKHSAFVVGDEVQTKVYVEVRLDDGTNHEIRDPEAMRLAWSQIMSRQPGVSRQVAYDTHWIQQIAKLS